MGQGQRGLKATEVVDFPASDAVLTWWPEAAFASDPAPIPRNVGPLKVRTSATAAREHRIFFTDTPFLLT